MKKLLIALISTAATVFCAQAETMACPIQQAASYGSSVWLLCERRNVIVSGDEGRTWKTFRLPVDGRMRAIAFLDSRRGFIAGEGGTLLATADGGETWRQVPLPTQNNLTGMHFYGNSGWVVGWSGLILHSSDGGQTWRKQDSGVLQGLEGVFFVDDQHGWVAGWNATILRTDDGGQSWRKCDVPRTVYSLDAVYFRDRKNGWAVGFGGEVLRSTDGGATWQEQPTPLRGMMKSIFFDSNGRGWVASDYGLLVSNDDGNTWTSVPVGSALFFRQVLPVNNSLWAIGQFEILKQTGGTGRFTALATLPASGIAAGAS